MPPEQPDPGVHTHSSAPSSRSGTLYDSARALFPAASKSLASMPAALGERFRLSAFGGATELPASRSGVVFFNDLNTLRLSAVSGSASSMSMRHVHVWWADGALAGIHTHLADGRSLAHGSTPPTKAAGAVNGVVATRAPASLPISSSSLTLKASERIIAVKIFAARRPSARLVTARPRDRKAIACLRLVTSAAEMVDFWNPGDKYADVETLTTQAPGPDWSLAGFYGEFVENGGKTEAEQWDCDDSGSGNAATTAPCIFERLGVIWGKI